MAPKNPIVPSTYNTSSTANLLLTICRGPVTENEEHTSVRPVKTAQRGRVAVLRFR